MYNLKQPIMKTVDLDARLSKFAQAFGFLQARLREHDENADGLCDELWAQIMNIDSRGIDFEAVHQAERVAWQKSREAKKV